MERTIKIEDIIIESLIYIEWHIEDGLKPADISTEMNYSFNVFKQMFSNVTGMELSSYLHLRTLIEAKKEWDITNEIEVIAAKYNQHPELLIKAFKKEFGYSFFDKRNAMPNCSKLIGKELIEAISNAA